MRLRPFCEMNMFTLQMKQFVYVWCIKYICAFIVLSSKPAQWSFKKGRHGVVLVFFFIISKRNRENSGSILWHNSLYQQKEFQNLNAQVNQHVNVRRADGQTDRRTLIHRLKLLKCNPAKNYMFKQATKIVYHTKIASRLKW